MLISTHASDDAKSHLLDVVDELEGSFHHDHPRANLEKMTQCPDMSHSYFSNDLGMSQARKYMTCTKETDLEGVSYGPPACTWVRPCGHLLIDVDGTVTVLDN